MADEPTRLTREQTNLRKFIRRCLESPKEPEFFAAIRGSLYEAAPLDIRDEIRLMELFERNMYEFTGDKNRPAYLAWATAWVARIARLTALAKTLLPVIEKQCDAYPQVAGPAVLYNLDSYAGPEESGALLDWASERARRAEANTVTFLEWYQNPAYQAAVRAGVWDVLRGCGNLGGTTYKGGDWHEDYVKELCSDAWRTIMEAMDELTQPSDKPIEARLWGKARNPVREHKTNCLRDRKKYITDDKYVRLADSEKLADEDAFTLSILTYAKGVPESQEDEEKRLKQEAKQDASVPPRRHCVVCHATLASWNKSEQSICVPCWQASQPDDYVRREYAESGSALRV